MTEVDKLSEIFNHFIFIYTVESVLKYVGVVQIVTVIMLYNPLPQFVMVSFLSNH